MDMKTNISAPGSPPPPVFPAKNEAAPKEVVSRGKETAVSRSKGTATADSKEKRGETIKEKDTAEVQEVLRKALDVDPIPQRKLQLSIENELNIVVFKVFDKESGDLVRQIPMPEHISISKKLRAAMEKMTDSQSGIAVNKEV